MPALTRLVTSEPDVWGRSVLAWPVATDRSDRLEDTLAERVERRVAETLVSELLGLEVGESLRILTALGNGTCETEVFRTGRLPSSPRSSLETAVRMSDWERLVHPLPAVGGAVVTAVQPVDATGAPIPWSRVPVGDGSGIWSGLIDGLARNGRLSAIVVDVLRVGEPSRATEMLTGALARRALERAGRRSGGTESFATEAPPTPAGNFLLAVGVSGDLDAVLGAYRSLTGTALRRDGGRAISSATAQMMASVTASQAAALLPLPVLPAHSTLPVPRFRLRTTAVTRPRNSSRAVTIARTDTGSEIAIDADAVNRNLLIVGDPSTGKSTTMMSLLTSLWNDHGIPWLVIDPMKHEYAYLELARGDDELSPSRVRHIRLGQTPINPLVRPPGVDRLAFASAMARAFSGSSELGDAFPLGERIASIAFNELYAKSRGTEPTFADLEAALMAASHQEGARGETADNIRTSLIGRLRAITSGAAGDVFAGGPRAGIDWEELSRFPTVITFPTGLGGQEKAVIYALLVAAHWSWRLANPLEHRHVVVLEEVHQVYGRGNPVASATLDSLLATMRAFGQGYFAVTQTPRQLDEQTQLLFPQVISHRLRHAAGLEMLQAFGPAAAEVTDLDDGEVLAVVHERHGVRGRVSDGTRRIPGVNPLVVPTAHRVSDVVERGPVVRGWCSACPRPCHGRSWLGFAGSAAIAADAALAGSRDVGAASEAAVNAVRLAAHAAGTTPSAVGTYCAAARGVTVALGVRRETDYLARRASQRVRDLVTDSAGTTYTEGAR